MRVKPGICLADLAWHRLALSAAAELAALSWANVKSKQPSTKKLIQKFQIAVNLLICDVSNINIDQSAKQNYFAT